MEKENVRKHIRSARQWLAEAEEWLEKSNMARMVGRLLLAVAEIQMPLREQFNQQLKQERKAEASQASKSSFRFYRIAASLLLTFGLAYGVYYFGLQQRRQLAEEHPRKQAEVTPMLKKAKIIIPEKKQAEAVAKAVEPKKVESSNQRKKIAQSKKRSYARKKKRAHIAKRHSLKGSLKREARGVEEKVATRGEAEGYREVRLKAPTKIAEKPKKTNLDVINLMFTAERALKGEKK